MSKKDKKNASTGNRTKENPLEGLSKGKRKPCGVALLVFDLSYPQAIVATIAVLRGNVF